jgi:hypothetical protein
MARHRKGTILDTQDTSHILERVSEPKGKRRLVNFLKSVQSVNENFQGDLSYPICQDGKHHKRTPFGRKLINGTMGETIHRSDVACVFLNDDLLTQQQTDGHRPLLHGFLPGVSCLADDSFPGNATK